MKKLLIASGVALLACSGCLKVREEFVVMPDGSGKIVLQFQIRNQTDAGKFTEAALMQGDPDEMLEKARGIVALSRPKLETKDGVSTIRMTAYFDDLNAVKFMDDEEGAKAKPKQEFSFRKDGEAFVVEIRGNVLAEEVPERKAGDPSLVKQREEMFKAMYAGFEFRQDVKLPGKVTSVDGFQSQEGRTATYAVGEKDLQRPADQKKINDAARFKVTGARSELTDAEISDFRKELEKAKSDWAELRKELKKNAEKK